MADDSIGALQPMSAEEDFDDHPPERLSELVRMERSRTEDLARAVGPHIERRSEGWLHKGDPNGRNWKHRFFVLDGASLSYYSDEKRGKKKGEIRLTGRGLVRNVGAKNANAFDITAVRPEAEAEAAAAAGKKADANASRSYYLYAETEDDMLQWMHSLHLAGANDGRSLDACLAEWTAAEDEDDGGDVVPWRDVPTVDPLLRRLSADPGAAAEGGRGGGGGGGADPEGAASAPEPLGPLNEAEEQAALEALVGYTRCRWADRTKHDVVAARTRLGAWLRVAKCDSTPPTAAAELEMPQFMQLNKVDEGITLMREASAAAVASASAAAGASEKSPSKTLLSTEVAEDESLTIKITVRLPDAQKALGMKSIVLEAGRDATVLDAITEVFNKFQRKMRQELDTDGPAGYVLKVHGYNDYLLNHRVPLLAYDHVRFCLREKVECILNLTKPDSGALSRQEIARASQASADEAGPRGIDYDSVAAGVAAGVCKEAINMSDILGPFRVKVIGLDDIDAPEVKSAAAASAKDPNQKVVSVHVRVGLYHGGEELQPTLSRGMGGGIGITLGGGSHGAIETERVPIARAVAWPSRWRASPCHNTHALPVACRLGAMVYGTTQSGEELELAGISLPLVDEDGRLRTGALRLRLWPHPNLQVARDPDLLKRKVERDPVLLNLAAGTGAQNLAQDAGTLHIVLDSYAAPVVAPVPTCRAMMADAGSSLRLGPLHAGAGPNAADKAELERLARADPLHALSAAEMQLLWKWRKHCMASSKLLPKVLMACPWGDPKAELEMRQLLPRWAKFDEPQEALELLDLRFSDPVVRAHAVSVIDKLPDVELQEYLLQLVQLVKYEPHHDSPLARLLLVRAIRCPLIVGFRLFWLLRSEMHVPQVADRFGLLLELYCRRCVAHRPYLARQVIVDDLLVVVAESIKTISGKKRRRESCRDRLAQIAPLLPSQFQVCLSPRFLVSGINAAKCLVMSSKKKPLMLWLQNAEEEADDVIVMFKSGDDLRQDLMTLQMLRIMDSVWLRRGLDLRMKPYLCCATGDDTGMLEIVTDSVTINDINSEKGGGILGAFKNSTIKAFLDENAKTEVQRRDAHENFVRTCAGYCVATFVMGIGDRHSDNIMITRAGHLFHIDFGHFLGHFKAKFGIKRERAPFVFTPAMAAAMGGRKSEGYTHFVRMSCQAFNILREYGNLLLNLFMQMVPAGMPELQSADDVAYLQGQLNLNLTEEHEAEKLFEREIASSLSTTSRQIDDTIHLWVHG